MAKKRKCRVCGKGFEPIKKNHVNCSRECAVDWSNRRAPSNEKGNCVVCGDEFLVKRADHRYCSNDCYQEGRKVRQRKADPAKPGITSATEADLVSELQSRGHRVVLDTPQERRVRLTPKAKRHHRFAVVSDTHLGSKHQQLTLLHQFYDLVVKEDIDTVLHVGDLVHGSHKMHRDAVYELHSHGADAQTDYAVENYPERDGVATWLISGNHDDAHWNDAGVDVCERFAERRDDVTYLGKRGAYLELGGVVIYLWHPKGGMSYAYSYKAQKSIERFSPDAKPHIVFMGHFHVANHLVAYRNVEGIQVPCYQSQTPFEKTLGLSPVVGGLILDMWTSDDGLEDLQTRWVINRIPIPNDF